MNESELTLAAFIEYGQGDYNSYNSFSSGKVKGSGDTDYKGIGILARNEYNSGFYLDGSLRAGKTDTDYRAERGVGNGQEGSTVCFCPQSLVDEPVR
jgi:hypothetical protein